MSEICIGVACHKPSKMPANPILIPIQVNSANASSRMEMAHDDEGDNISIKNPNYCELTAQYWLWKNVKADYYGLCHYRRFLCFTVPDKVKRNYRDQIVGEVLDDYNIERYGLNDEKQMRSVIESNDVVCGDYQKVSKLYSPRGNQTTGYKHWAAHDRALIMKKDLDKMLEILDQVSPEVGSHAREYLNKNIFSGFNCFVMKKALFDEMCSIEFEVLNRLEKEVDLTHYCQQLTRIYGFMGEIISSSYIYHLEQLGRYRVKHVPLVYFNYTDEPKKISPSKNENSVHVVFYASKKPELIAPTWQSFLNHTDSDRFYDVVLISKEPSSVTKQLLVEMASGHNNVQVRMIDAVQLLCQIEDRFVHCDEKREKIIETFPFLPFIPHCLPEFKRALIFTENNLFATTVDGLWDTFLDEKKAIACPLDSMIIAEVNDIYPETRFNHLKTLLKDPYSYYSINAMLVDMDEYRKQCTPERIAKSICNQYGRFITDSEAVNVLFEGMIQKLPQEWNTCYEADDFLRYQLPYNTLENMKEQVEARKNPKIISYNKENPWELEMNEVTNLYWKTACETPFYDYLQAYRVSYMNEHKEKLHLTRALFPKGSAIHGVISRTIPKDSTGYKIIKNALSKFHME